MKTIIAGSRDGVTLQDVEHAMYECGWEPSEVVCGNARGADSFGKEWAMHLGIPVKFFDADWERYGKRAGLDRNWQMAKYADALVLVWDGKSRGSLNMLQQAEQQGLRIHVHYLPKSKVA